MALHPGDGRVKLGYLCITIPFLLHYYGTFALRLQAPDAAHTSSLPDRMRDLGQWAVALSAIACAACFAPRPFWKSSMRPAPMVIAGFVGAIVAVILIRHEDVGREIAMLGLGIEYMPGAPAPMLITFGLGAAAVAFTLTTTLTHPSGARRLLGAGYALVVVGGYAFAWPAQLLSAAVGALAITEASMRLPDEENEPGSTRMPVIPAEVWGGYIRGLAAALGAEARTEEQGGAELTRIAGTRGAVPYELVIARTPAGIDLVQVDLGPTPSVETPPAFTLHARGEGIIGRAAHPSPPEIPDAPSARSGDEAFDRRFRLRDAGGFTARLFDEGLRARATAVLDGWIAVWRAGGVRWRVCPGRGAPLDHPVPIPSLAFLGEGDPARMVNVVDLLAELAGRVAS
jgi:hypothetical protein